MRGVVVGPLERLERELGELGVPSRRAKPSPPVPGEEWWSPPLDAWPLLGLALYTGRASIGETLVVEPRSPGEVVRALQAAERAGACIIPRGGGSGVLGAASPRDECAILSLERLDTVRVDPGDGIVEAGAGARLWRVEEALARHGLTTGLYPQSIRSATVGGLISTLGSGALQPGLGNVEDVVLYIDIVAPRTGLARLGSPARPRGLLLGAERIPLGAEGGLGVVVAAGLRARPVPRHTESLTARFGSLEAALEYSRRLAQWNQPAVLRLLDERESALLYGAEGYNVIVAYMDDLDPETPRALAGKALRAAERLGGRKARDLYAEWWEKRYSYAEQVRAIVGAGLWFDTIDLQAPWTRLPRVYQEAIAALDRIDCVAAAMAHASHFTPNGGSLYITMATSQDTACLARAWRSALDAALRAGGSVTHHHGIGLMKLYHAARELGAEERVYCALKTALDPRGVLRSGGVAARCRTGGTS